MLGTVVPSPPSEGGGGTPGAGAGAGGGLIGGNEAGPGPSGSGGGTTWSDSSTGGSSCIVPLIMAVPELPAALYLVVDRSRLMQNDPPQQQNGKWSDLVSGLSDYLNSNDAGSTLNVGMAYYPFPCPQRLPTRDCSTGGMVCDVSANSEPFPEIGPVTNARDLLNRVQSPISTGPPVLRVALEGALQHVRDWEKTHRNEFVIPVIIAGGPPDPMNCMPNTIGDAQEVAANSNSKIYVIAFETNSSPFDGIARNGGTDAAFQIDGRQNAPSITTQFADTFQTILDDDHRSCVFELPQSANPSNINVVMQPGDQFYFQVDNRASCQSRNATRREWYYDDPSDRKHIILCDVGCQNYRGQRMSGGQLQIVVGCQTTR
jgi:hypothetical protein